MKPDCLFFRVAVWVSLLAALERAPAQQWAQANAPAADWTSAAVCVDGSRLVAVAYTNGIYISTNAGVDWIQTSAPAEPWFGVASSADGSTLVALTDLFDARNNPLGGAIYASTNSGSTWTKTSAPRLPWFRGVIVSADGTRWAAVAYTNGIYTSTNLGGTWEATSAPSYPWNCLAASADGTKLVAGSDGGSICTSTNSGANWRVTIAPNQVWYAVASSADGTKLAAVSPEARSIYTSTNSGANWKRTTAPSMEWMSIASSAEGVRLVAVPYQGPIYASTNAGVTWQTTNPSSTNHWFAAIASADGGISVALGYDWKNAKPGFIHLSQSIFLPRLNLTLSGGDAILSWVIPSADFTLQESGDLSTANWTEVGQNPTIDITTLQNQVRTSLHLNNRYYRLKH
jgi:photosystem II stability/assembly factor-like uncharacterized protein